MPEKRDFFLFFFGFFAVPSVHRSAVSRTPNKNTPNKKKNDRQRESFSSSSSFFWSFWLNFATWRANELSPTRGLSRGKEIFLKDASLLIPCITFLFGFSFAFAVFYIGSVSGIIATKYFLDKKAHNSAVSWVVCFFSVVFFFFFGFLSPKEARCESRMLDAVIFFVRPAQFFNTDFCFFFFFAIFWQLFLSQWHCHFGSKPTDPRSIAVVAETCSTLQSSTKRDTERKGENQRKEKEK